MSPERVDAVVIGGGPAGLSAALWLGRHRLQTVVIDSCAYRNGAVVESYGYFTADCANPAELRRLARKDLDRYETARLREQSVQRLEQVADGEYDVVTDGETIRCRAVVLATGVRDDLPDVHGLVDHYGTSVFHCPQCDGFEVRGKPVAVIGCDTVAIDVAKQLTEWASKVTVVVRSDGDEPCPPHARRAGIAARSSPARRVLAKGEAVTGLELSDGEIVRAEVIFFSTQPRASNELARSLGCALDGEGYVIVDAAGMTNVSGVFAAGDLVPGPKLIQIAAASGAVSGIGCAEYLKSFSA